MDLNLAGSHGGGRPVKIALVTLVRPVHDHVHAVAALEDQVGVGQAQGAARGADFRAVPEEGAKGIHLIGQVVVLGPTAWLLVFDSLFAVCSSRRKAQEGTSPISLTTVMSVAR